MSDPDDKAGDNVKLGLAGHLTRAFVTSPLTPLFIIAALAVGLVALVTLPREEEPQISVPLVDIHIDAAGLRAPDAVQLVTEPMETIVKAINDVEHVYSQTRDDGAMVTARFEVGTSTDAAVLRVHDKVRANMDRIPVGIPEPLIVGRGIDDVAIVSLTFSAEPAAGLSANDLTRVAREVRSEIAKVDEVGLSYLVGEVPETLRVAPDPEKLALYGVTLQQLAGKLSGANRTFNTGKLRDGGQQIDLIAGETLVAPAQVANLLVTTRDGRAVYVGDVAEVSFVADDSDRIVSNVTRGNDGAVQRAPAVTLAVAKRAGANAVIVAEDILHKLDTLKGELIPTASPWT